MEKQDWVLLVLGTPAARQVSPVQLQKTLFLIGEKLPLERLKVDEFYHFEPYDFGAFCQEVYADASRLAEEGLVHIDQVPHRSYRVYSATEEGRVRAAELRLALDPKVTDYVDRLVAWATALTFSQLVRAVYEAYPDTRVNSVFVDR